MHWIPLFRRFLTVSALGLWLGGFTVYTAFVIPVGHRHFSSGRFGFVTGEITSVLNLLALIAAPVLLVNVIAEWGGMSRILRWGSVASWGLIVLATLTLFLIHAKLDGVMDYPHRGISDRERFEPLHERYELVATLQWAAGLIHLGCILAGWRRSDARTAQEKKTVSKSPLPS